MNSEEPAIFRHIHSCQRQLQAAAPALPFKAQAVASAIVLRLGTLATQARSQRSPLEEIEQALNTLDEELLTAMRASLPLAEIQVLQTIARQETAPYRRRLPSPRIEKMEVQCIERDLREKYMLPRFGLFYMLPFSNLTPEKRDCSFPERERRPSTKDENSTQLPIWPESVRGGPNALLRSVLFAGIHSKKRQTLGVQTRPEVEPEGVTIAAQDGIRIKYAGTQLNQYDADVFFEALHRARRHPLGTECRFQGAAFLKSIGRSDSKLNYEDLNNSLRRLKRGTVDIDWTVRV